LRQQRFWPGPARNRLAKKSPDSGRGARLPFSGPEAPGTASIGAAAEMPASTKNVRPVATARASFRGPVKCIAAPLAGTLKPGHGWLTNEAGTATTAQETSWRV